MPLACGLLYGHAYRHTGRHYIKFTQWGRVLVPEQRCDRCGKVGKVRK